MYIFWEYFAAAPCLTQVFSLLQLAFTVWMLVDAYQRRVEPFWYWVIFLFQPLGSWVYFFVVKFRTLRLPGMGQALTREHKLSLDKLRTRVERAPTVANRLVLAERLMGKGEHREAIPLLEAILAIEPDYCAVLYALATCQLATGGAEQAVAPLERLLQRDPRWGTYRAWRTLVEVHLARSQPAAALAACRELTKRLPTLETKCLLAEHLLDNANPTEAVQLLDEALEDYHDAAWSARWRNWHWASEARRLLAEAEKNEKKKENL